MQNIFEFDIDFKKQNFINEPVMTQNDYATFVINVLDNDEPVDLAGATTITLASLRPDQKSIIIFGERGLNANQIVFEISRPENAVIGRVEATVQFYDAESRVSTAKFNFRVEKDPSNISPSGEDKTLIELVLGEGPAILDAVNLALPNIENLEPIGEYDVAVDYLKNNIVSLDGASYMAKSDTIGNDPTDDAFWLKIANKGDVGPQGIQGPEGPEGPIGPEGPQGIPGQNGTGAGTVTAVNGELPDGTGNVTLTGLATVAELQAETQARTTHEAETANRLAEIVTRPETYGAVGDGIAIDSVPLQTALSVGGRIQLKQGKTYIVDRLISMTPGTVIDGNGATIKRIDSYQTTLSSGLSDLGNSKFSFSVSSIGSLIIGQDIMLYKSNGTYSPYNHRITEIVGNTVTIAKQGSGTLDFVSGDFVCRSSKVLQMYDMCTIRDLTIDGNKENNSFNSKWQNNQAVVGWSNTLIENCVIINEQGEGIVQFLDNGRIFNTRIENCGGNGIHFSGSNKIVVTGCMVKNTNLTTAVGHDDGNLCWSNSCQYITISDCHLENGKSGFGSIDYGENSNIIATGNDILNQRVSAVDMDVRYAESGVSNIVFSNNKFYNSKGIIIKDIDKINFSNEIIFVDNLFINTFFDVNNVKGFKLSGNTFKNTISSNLITIDSSEIEISNNYIDGGNFALLFLNCRGIVNGNSIVDSLSGAIVDGDPVNASDILVSNNDIRNSLTIPTNNLVVLRKGSVFRGNKISGNSVKYGIYVSGSSVIVYDNHVKVASGTTVRLDTGHLNVVVERNYISSAVSNPNTDPSNTVQDNKVIIP